MAYPKTIIEHSKFDAMLSKIQEHLKSVNTTLRAFALKLTGDSADAADLYQDTAMRIIANADKYQENTNFKAWAVTIMRNVFINNYRKKVRRGAVYYTHLTLPTIYSV